MIYSTSDNALIQVRYALKYILKDYHLAHLSQVHRSIVLNLTKRSSYDLSLNGINFTDRCVPVMGAYKDSLLDLLKCHFIRSPIIPRRSIALDVHYFS